MDYADNDVLIVAAARTPFGRFGGGLSSLPAVDLGARVISEVVARAGIEGDTVDQVIMGTVITAGMGQIPARQAALKAGLPTSVSALTVNKVCASSLKAVNLGALLIRAGEADVVVAGGMESMSQAPYLLPGARFGLRMGSAEMVDSMQHDGLRDPVGNVLMAGYGSEVAAEYEISREDQDEFALRSHQRAVAAQEGGRFEAELVPVAIPQKKGEPLTVAADEGPRADSSLESLGRLKPVFQAEGTVTAGNASLLNDGASALVLMEAGEARRRGLPPRETFVGAASAGVHPSYMGIGPVPATRKALAKAGLSVRDVDLVELNEAFAAQSVACLRELALDEAKVNVNGGAIALGHPLGSSGSRLICSLTHEMNRSGAEVGLATMCIGVGQGIASVWRRG